MNADFVGEVEVGIVDRVEAGAVFGRVRIGKRSSNGISCRIDRAGFLHGHGLPLAGRGVQANVAVGSDAHSILDDRDTALMAVGVDVLERHHIDAGTLEVFFIVDLNALGLSEDIGCAEEREIK